MSDDVDFTIRDLTEFADLERAVAFQHLIWGPGFTDAVPAVMLTVANHTGGIIAGAFDGNGEMAGLLFGITGFRDGQPLHWSDMLGVRPDMRSRGLGQALKHHQREVMLRRGVNLVRWTFDPLEARNAYLNFTKLGCTAREYVRDCYGQSASPLHAGLGTDRLIVDWRLDSPAVRQRMERSGDRSAEAGPALPAPGFAAMPLANPSGPAAPILDLAAPAIRVRIPARIQEVRDAEPRTAVAWRATTRAIFEAYLGRGYTVTGVVREGTGGSSYVLRSGYPAEPEPDSRAAAPGS